MWEAKVPYIKVICRNPSCKKEFELQPAVYRTRMKNSRSGDMFCGKRCMNRSKNRQMLLDLRIELGFDKDEAV